MFEAGLDIKEIQYLAGHSSVDMTLRVYTHYDQRSRRAKTAEKVREAHGLGEAVALQLTCILTCPLSEKRRF